MNIRKSKISHSSQVFSAAYLEDEGFDAAFNSRKLLKQSDAELFFYYLSSTFSLQDYSTYCIYENDEPIAAMNFGTSKQRKKPTRISPSKLIWYLNGIRLRLIVDKSFLESFSKYSELVFEQSSGEDYLSISQLGVLKDHRRKGCASALINLAFEKANQLDNCKGIQVATYSEHNSKIYEKLGFVEKAKASNNGITCWILTKEK